MIAAASCRALKRLIQATQRVAHGRFRTKRAKEIQDSIRKILYHDWNPIGFAGLLPEDEYDSYIAPIYRMLSESSSEDELIEYLFLTEQGTVGVSCERRDHLRDVALKLLQLKFPF
jgi:hypothetical protein